MVPYTVHEASIENDEHRLVLLLRRHRPWHDPYERMPAEKHGLLFVLGFYRSHSSIRFMAATGRAPERVISSIQGHAAGTNSSDRPSCSCAGSCSVTNMRERSGIPARLDSRSPETMGSHNTRASTSDSCVTTAYTAMFAPRRSPIITT